MTPIPQTPEILRSNAIPVTNHVGSGRIPVTSVGDDTQDRAELHGESRVVGDESRRNGRGRSYEGSGRKKSKYKSGAGRSPNTN